eukprot:TRINITY_DN3113_c0_g1_i1.p1 TRINITY_DN3113_c0_g1~~TRINITY_DN3113_c0_g1_i1.p1  ORF type:complete len:202 (-),score=43.40 TRINITY_DN3113_c0_g1_i1:104-709(-)
MTELFYNNTSLMVKYPNINRLWKDIGLPLINFLQKEEIVKAYKIKGNFDHSDGGVGGCDAWSNFESSLKNLIAGILTQIDEQIIFISGGLATHISDEYYKRYPRWPSTGTSQTATIQLSCKCVETVCGFTYVSQLTGIAEVKVTNYGERKTTKLNVQGSLKLLTIDLYKMEELETRTQVNYDGAKNIIFKYKEAQPTQCLT